MQCSHGFRGVAAIVVLAALATHSSGAMVQGSFEGSSDDVKKAPAALERPQPDPQKASSTPTQEEIGDAMMVHQRYQAAIEAYRHAGQNSPDVWNKMGIAYQMMYNQEDAARCYKASLALNPGNSHVFNNLGTIYESQKRYGDAERMYRKAIHLAPGSALTYKNLGTALLAQHSFKKGWAAYQMALALDPKIFVDRASPRVQDPGSAQERGAMNYYMARGCVRAGLNDCAIDHLRRALNEGFTDEKKIEADGEFAGLRGSLAFEQLLAEQKLQ